MLTGQSDSVVRMQRAERAKMALQLLWLLPVVAAAFVVLDPMWSVPGVVLLGVVAGYFASERVLHVEDIKAPDPISPYYEPTQCESPGINPNIYLGDGIDLRAYKDGLDRMRKKYGKVTARQKRAYSDSLIEKMAPIFMQDEASTRHCAVIGKSGEGKSEMFISWAKSQIERGGGLIMFDAKGDEKMFTSLYQIIKSCGREQDLRYINFDRPDMSNTYNPFMHGNVRQLTSTAMKLYGTIENGSSEYFGRVTRVGLLAAMITLLSQPVRVSFCFKDLAAMFAAPEEFAELLLNIPDTPEHEDARSFLFMFLNSWIKQDPRTGEFHIDKRQWSEDFKGLQTMLLDFCHSDYAKLLNSYSPDIELKDDLLNNRIIIITLPALSDKQGTEVFGRLFMADLSRAIGQISSARIRPALPFLVVLDEYGSFKDESHVELWQQARSCNISLLLSIQGRGFLDSENVTFANNLLTNINTFVYFASNDEETRKTAAATAGSNLFNLANNTISNNYGASHQNYHSGLIHQEAFGKGMSHGARETREDLIQPEDFDMFEGEAIMIGKGGSYHMRMPLVVFSDQLPTLDEIQLPRAQPKTGVGLNLDKKIMKKYGYKLEALLAATT